MPKYLMYAVQLLFLCAAVRAASWFEPVEKGSSTAGPDPLSLHTIPQSLADSFGAKCLDGSPPSSYILPQDPSRWVIFVEGGGWCQTLASCAGRARGSGGSSHGLAPTMDVGGLLSPDPTINPRFNNWTFVFMHYCDGSSHTSNATLPYMDGNSSVWFRGRPNLIAQFAYLSTLGLDSASDVIYTGGSAGGMSVFLSLDFVRDLLPPSTRLVGAPDAGFFIDAPLWNNATAFAFRQEFMNADLFWNSTGAGNLNSRCLAAFADEKWRCFFPENYGPYIQTPWHSMMAAYDLASLSMIINLGCLPPKCNATELEALHLWRYQFLGALGPAVTSFPFNGAYVDSCLVHEQNVDYCSGQSVPNCRGWNLYNVTASGYAAALTPQEGFSVWYDALSINYERVVGERAAWAARIDKGIASGSGYPQRRAKDAQQQVIIIDPSEWPGNPSCPFGTT